MYKIFVIQKLDREKIEKANKSYEGEQNYCCRAAATLVNL